MDTNRTPTPAPRCTHRVPVDRCPVHAPALAAAPTLVFDGE